MKKDGGIQTKSPGEGASHGGEIQRIRKRLGIIPEGPLTDEEDFAEEEEMDRWQLLKL